MAGMEGDKRPGRTEAAFHAGFSRRAGQQPGSGERDKERPRQSAENRILSLVSTVQRQEGEPVDPYRISDALMSYHERVSAKARGLTSVEGWLTETKEPTGDEETMIKTIRQVRNAFDIIAYHRFPESYQKTLSSEVYGSPFPSMPPLKTHQGEFTLTLSEKRILTQIAALAGVQDNLDQLTYSFSSIPHLVESD
jgi:hypothetical protein